MIVIFDIPAKTGNFEALKQNGKSHPLGGGAMFI